MMCFTAPAFRSFLTTFLLLTAFGSLAQAQTLTGQITDGKAGLPYAAVALFDATDSTQKAGAATDPDGRFSLEAAPGSYFLKVAFLSYKDTVIDGIILQRGGRDLGEVRLRSNELMLDEFTVEAEKTQMELKLDKRVFNIGKDLSNGGADASEVLDNIPSVDVDAEGNVSLRGSGNVRILIDGKPSGLVGISGTDGLRQLQGDLIERIEIITNPSARYDAEGEVGIINIILKKERQNGVNGSFTLRAGWPHNHGGSFNLNAKTKKVNYFGGYGFGFRRGPGGGFNNQTFTYPDTTYRYEQVYTHRRGGPSHNGRLGMDLTTGENSTLTLSGNFRYSEGDHRTDNSYRDFDENDVLTQIVERAEEEIDEHLNLEGNLNYRRTWDKSTDRLFTFSARFTDGGETESADIGEVSNNPLYVPQFQRSFSEEDERNVQFQTDYVHPIGDDGKFEIGAKSQLRSLTVAFLVENREADGTWEAINGFDGTQVYDENIHAAYVMAGNKKGKVSYQAGLRAEYSDVTTTLTVIDSVNQRTYLNLFPSAHFSYSLSESADLQLSYSRRVNRPRHWWLSPFFSFADARNFMSGNPNLNPEYTNSMELGYLKQWEKGNLLSSVYYRHSTDIMRRILISDSVGFTRNFPVNLGDANAYGIEFSGTWEPLKWWSITGNSNFFYRVATGSYDGLDLSAESYVWTSRINMRFKIKRKFSAQTSFDYSSPQQTRQGSSLATYAWNGGAALEVLKGNGTLSANVRDLLNSRKWRNLRSGPNFYSESERQWRARQFSLSFTYRLNQKKGRGERGGDFGGGGGDF